MSFSSFCAPEVATGVPSAVSVRTHRRQPEVDRSLGLAYISIQKRLEVSILAARELGNPFKCYAYHLRVNLDEKTTPKSGSRTPVIAKTA